MRWRRKSCRVSGERRRGGARPRFAELGEHNTLSAYPQKAALDSRSVEENSAWLVQVIKEAYGKHMEHAEALRGSRTLRHPQRGGSALARTPLRHGWPARAVSLRAAQKDPLVEYKNEAFSMFGELMDNIKLEVLNLFFRSTTGFRGTTSLPQHLIQADVPGLSRPQTGRHRQHPRMENLKRRKLNSPLGVSFPR